MSVEGLLSEVKHFNAHHLDAALGEQLFYGGKRVFSDVKPGTSSGGDHGIYYYFLYKMFNIQVF